MSRTVPGILIVWLCVVRTLAAQDPVPVDSAAKADTVVVVADSSSQPAIAVAAALRDKRDFAAAAEVLRDILMREPDNGDAARMLAQTLYWLGHTDGARSLYEENMRRFPHDTALRLDFARMLLETRSEQGAMQILEPLMNATDTRARAAALVGTLYYWKGEYAKAKHFFTEALAADPGLVDAQRQLREINAASAPWMVAGAGTLHDDQPLDRFEGEIAGGFYINPLATFSAAVRPIYLSTPDYSFSRTVVADAGGSLSIPSARMETALRVGAAQRARDESAVDWTGRFSMRLRLPVHAYIEGRAERSPYFATAASLATPVMVNAGAMIAGLEHPRGWVSEAAYKVEGYGDGGHVQTAFAWLLAPLVRTSRASVSAGYAVSRQDADTSAFSGFYSPYYTPENVLTHTAIASVTLRPSAKSMVRLHGGYGFAAREDAPVLPSSAGGVTLITFERRDFKPWNANFSLETAVTDRTSVTLAAQSMKTAFYEATSGNVRVTYHFRQRNAR